MLLISGLEKSFKSRRVLDGLNLTVGDNEVFGFVGKNGTGKTTTMRIIAGLLLPDNGQVMIDGVDAITNAREIKRKIGYMPDFFGAYSNIKVEEYMEYFASLYGMYGKEVKRRCFELLELVNLDDKLDVYVDDMSRGMKQRLCLARCLIHYPKLIILDEPASGLDPKARYELKEIIGQLKDMGKTVIISSHILPELAAMSDKIGIMDKGKIVCSGKIDDIRDSLSIKSRRSIEILDNMQTAIDILHKQQKVDELAILDNTCTFVFDGNDMDMALLLKKMSEKGVLFLTVTKKQESLEKLFTMITSPDGKEDNIV